MKRIRDLSTNEGIVGDVVWWTRQFTGTGFQYRGYVRAGGEKMGCGHKHRKPMAARRCAADLAKAVSDGRVKIIDGAIGPEVDR